MKRLALVAAVFFVAACAKKETAQTADTAAAPAMAPAPADTTMKMDSMKMDSMKKDSAMKDSAMKAAKKKG